MKSLFWMKQIQGSVRAKIKEYVHAWSEFLFVSLLTIFNFFPQIKQFYYFTSLHDLQDVESHGDQISSWRLVKKFHISAFPMYYSLYNWIGEHKIAKLKKTFASKPGKRTQKQAQKYVNEIEWHKMDYLIFSAMRMRKRHLFCTSSRTVWKQQELIKGSEPWNECPCQSACAIGKYALH